MKYNFTLNEIGTPQLNFNEEFWQLSELASCEDDYLDEIIDELSSLLNGEISEYDFGYEVYLIRCDNINCEVIDTFNDWNVEYQLSTSDLFAMLHKWRNFIRKNS